MNISTANPAVESAHDVASMQALARSIRAEGARLGFSQIAISDVNLAEAEAGLLHWLEEGYHGEMQFMARHGTKRSRPAELLPGTLRVISVRMDYLSPGSGAAWREREIKRIDDAQAAVVSIYARGRDYHKVIRQRLQALVEFIAHQVDPHVIRAFSDSAPVMEVALAANAGVGWRGKHTLLLAREAGSMFFLGEIYIGLPLPVDAPQQTHCGTCTRCIDICPTRAIVAPYVLDARRCISYLTIELAGPIPTELRPLLGNRVYGCDDCQLVCPWNKYARTSPLPDFMARHGLDDATLLGLWAWSEADFLRRTEGSAIRRLGYVRFRRNIAVALGNARRRLPQSHAIQPAIAAALQQAMPGAHPLVAEHIAWALAQQPAADSDE